MNKNKVPTRIRFQEPKTNLTRNKSKVSGTLNEMKGAFGDTHKVKTGVRLGKMSFRLVVVPKRADSQAGRFEDH